MFLRVTPMQSNVTSLLLLVSVPLVWLVSKAVSASAFSTVRVYVKLSLNVTNRTRQSNIRPFMIEPLSTTYDTKNSLFTSRKSYGCTQILMGSWWSGLQSVHTDAWLNVNDQEESLTVCLVLFIIII
jgi:hypothetical protein